MAVHARSAHFSRRAVLRGGALTIAFALTDHRTELFAQGASRAPRILDPNGVDAFLAVNGDGTVTIFCGKVDLGQGLRIAIRQMAAEELGLPLTKLDMWRATPPSLPIRDGLQGRAASSAAAYRFGKLLRPRARHSSSSRPDAWVLSPTTSSRWMAKCGRKQVGPAFALQI